MAYCRQAAEGIVSNYVFIFMALGVVIVGVTVVFVLMKGGRK